MLDEKVTIPDLAPTGERESVMSDLQRIDFTHHHHLDLCIDRTPEGHEALIASLSSAVDPCERTFAANALGLLADPKVIPALEMAILTPGENIFVIEAALRSLAQYGESARFSTNSVVRLLSHESAIVRVAATACLSALRVDSATLIANAGPKISDQSLGVRREAAHSLSELPGSDLTEISPRALQVLESGEGDASLVTDLLKIVSKAGVEVDRVAAVARERMRDSDPLIRLAALNALVEIGPAGEVAGEDLLRIAGNPMETNELRRCAVAAIKSARYFDAESLMDLGRTIEEEILENSAAKVGETIVLKRDVIALLGSYGDKAVKAAPYLRRALQSGDHRLVASAADALARMEAFEIMIDALNSTDLVVMKEITDAIQGIVYKLKASKRAKLIALLKLKLGWVKNTNLVDSILALLHILETGTFHDSRDDEQPALESPVDLPFSLQA